MGSNGEKSPLTNPEARGYYHYFTASVYFFPLIGAILSDWLVGKYRIILSVSIVYCLGHLSLALDETRVGLFICLALIAIGVGGIKPCVSANVGDQFGKLNQHPLGKVFGWFYFSINFGAFFSTLITPWLLAHYGSRVGFGVPGILMMLATIIFWLGRNEFVRVPAAGIEFVQELFTGGNPTALNGESFFGGIQVILTSLLKVLDPMLGLFLFVAVLFSLYDQSSSAWVQQAEKMDLHFFGVTCQAAQVQAINPLLILVFIPLFTDVVYPAVSRVFPLTPLRRIAVGLFLTVISFLIPGWLKRRSPSVSA